MMSLRNKAAALVVVAIAVTIGLMASGGLRTADAQVGLPVSPLPSFDCVGAEPELCIGLFPDFETNAVDTEHTVTATVTEDDAASVGTVVAFDVTDGPNIGGTGTDTTDANGEASFTYTGDGGPGFDTIRACVVDLCVEVFKDWFEPQIHQMSLLPGTATNDVGTDHTVTATVTTIADDAPVVGIQVNFFVFSPDFSSQAPNQGEFAPEFPLPDEQCSPNDCTTDVSGKVSFTYTGDGGPGTDGIGANACIDFQCFQFVFAEASKVWEQHPTITLNPPTDSNTVGTDHTVTATVVEFGGRVENEKVTFTVTAGPNKADTGTDTTDANGEATFTYTGDGGAGTDTIQACIFDEVDEKDVCATAEKTWEAVVLAEVQAPSALPTTGGTPSDGSSGALPWLAAIAGAIALVGSGSAWLAYQRRRVR